MNILFVGDIVGAPGRQAARQLLPGLRREFDADLVLANGENAAGGIGLTPEVAEELFSCGIDVLTTGNHVWDKKEILPALEKDVRLLRPANYPEGAPGRGSALVAARNGEAVGVINLSGRVFFPTHLDCPFRSARQELEALSGRARVIIVDLHAEATSEKVAMGWFLAGRVTAVVGTHTHVQTADARVLPGGTAYITDVGMTGPTDSVIGIKTELVLERFQSQRPVRFEVARGAVHLSAVVVEADSQGRALSIHSLTRPVPGTG
ncbi:MAG: TIGR00282 family metallophosphoesterase [Acetobacteraceae bacterium]|nr:TIGR00282 family metallophosphoesterase [Acetobacteraceae bacterium]